MRAVLLVVAAVMFGLAGGYAWSAIGVPSPHVHVPPIPKTKPLEIPETPADQEWATRGDGKPAAPLSAKDRKAIEQSAHYAGCDEVRAAGKAPLHAGDPGYSLEMDGDGDGIACEPHPGA